MVTSEVIPIEYGVYSDSEADAVARLLGEVFSRRDPPAVAVGLTALWSLRSSSGYFVPRWRPTV